MRNSLNPKQVQERQRERKTSKLRPLPSQNIGRNFESENLSIEKNRDDNTVCKQILDSDPSIRVAAFIEGAEVTGYAETARTKNSLARVLTFARGLGSGQVLLQRWRDRPTSCLVAQNPCLSHTKG